MFVFSFVFLHNSLGKWRPDFIDSCLVFLESVCCGYYLWVGSLVDEGAGNGVRDEG
jgi:hypothetical protein